ncbi:hypothetical protein LEP1GSC062_1087 [Leptospira alexanderi serovar Manhao 3 str. L 60]|uniref:Uncharacterized protein n=1 Tax=Leptospira alexanderi serovar Manhao 3 str. L 60 TaxID=1049759 RepID=V6I0M7_9LEPT|nr:hypothetical protein LEP1GSC062_1087 [Leptospira alexanderi serovar Manhao 3 str. L 60]
MAPFYVRIFSQGNVERNFFYLNNRLRKHKILVNYILKIFLKLKILTSSIVNSDNVFKLPGMVSENKVKRLLYFIQSIPAKTNRKDG